MKDGKSVLLLLALIIFFVYVLRQFLGRISALFFVPVDSLLFISHGVPPVIMWMLFGLLIGLIFGSVIAVKKYKLDFKLLVYPICIFIGTIALILIISYFVNKIPGNSSLTDSGITATSTSKPVIMSPEKLIKFNETLDKGIEAAKNENYQDAQDYFKKAAKIATGHSRLDSLSFVYSEIAKAKCKMYTHDPQLKYIPNYYFQYAAALTSRPPDTCD